MISEDKSGNNYEYGCLMLYVDVKNWHGISQSINHEDLYKPEETRYGIETDPHITILYGIHKDVDDYSVKELFKNLGKSNFDIKINGIDCFFNKDYDVLKFNIDSKKLHELNRLAKSLPNTNEYPEYKPHMTIAYLKKGTGQKYINENFNIGIDNIIKIVYSKPSGESINIPLN